MTLTIDLTPDEEARLRAAARRRGLAPAECAHKLLAEHLPDVEEASKRFSTLDEAIAKMTHRTPEEIEETRRRVLEASRPPRDLPPGKTLADVVVGQWPGDETDEQIQEALERLS